MDLLLEPFVFLPEIAGEGNEQHRSESPDAHHDHHPQRDGLTGGGVSAGQLHAFGAQLWLVPHVQPFLDRDFVRIPSEIQDHTTRWRLIPECRPCTPPLSHDSRPRCSVDKQRRSPTGSETCIHYRFLPGRSFPKKRQKIT